MEQGGEAEVEYIALKPELVTDIEWAKIRKMSTDRLRSKLIKEGHDKESVAAITQSEELIEMVAECVVEKRSVEKDKLATEKREEEEKQAREQKEEIARKEKEEEKAIKWK